MSRHGDDPFGGSALATYSGRRFSPLRPRASDVEIVDIAHALSNLCRFAGHTRVFYSVAEHSVRVARIVPEELRLQALLHDAAEAYIVDMPGPIKHAFVGYHEVEVALLHAIGERFGVSLHPMAPEIQRADRILLATEGRDLLHHPADGEWFSGAERLDESIMPMLPVDAEVAFLGEFWRSYGDPQSPPREIRS